MPNPNNCLRYWDLADHIRIDDAIALWCGVEPAELASLNFETRIARPSFLTRPAKPFCLMAAKRPK